MIARMCLPFCSLLVKTMVHEGVLPLKDGKILVRRRPISIASLQKSESHSSAERKKQNLSITPKSESIQHVTHSGHGSTAHTTPGHTETASPHIPEPQTTSTQLGQSSSHVDRLTILVEGLHGRISGLTNVIYSTNSQVQMHLITIETQLDAIQCKPKESL